MKPSIVAKMIAPRGLIGLCAVLNTPLPPKARRRAWLPIMRLLLCLFLGWQDGARAETQEQTVPQTGVGKEIFTILEGKQHQYLNQADFSSRAEDMAALYKAVGHQLLWLDRADSAALLQQVLELLANAPNEGLNPQNYEIDKLKEMLPAALQLPEVAVRKRALYDTAVSLSLLRYLHDLHYGRVNPQGINFNLKLRDKKLTDLPAAILANRAPERIAHLPDEVEPKLNQYKTLKRALAEYRDLAARVTPITLNVSKPLRVGEKHPQLAELRQFLIQSGMLEDSEPTPKATAKLRYDKTLSEGVKRFQAHHGLTADGVLGPGTAAAMSVPLGERATQIELALERLRWLPDIGAGPHIIVNIPAFQMWAYDDISKDQPEIMNMRVVVGQAMKNQTPVLMAEMRFIDFSPYWNVPYSITKKEIVPILQSRPGYLYSQNMEIVASFSDHAKAIPLTAESLLQLKQGILKVRQRPGKKNPLGKVKFMFPNKDDVYLHDTSSKSLFRRSERDFSHGCVRVENPLELAKFVLQGQPEWDEEKIKEAMQAGKLKRVTLKKSVPVLFFYTTAFAEPNGNVAFYRDIYGHDTVLIEALKHVTDLSDQQLFVSENSTSESDPAKTGDWAQPLDKAKTPN